MKRGRSTGTPSLAQCARFDDIHEIGCIACIRKTGLAMPCEIHHLTTGGRHGQKRLGHDHTVGLCPWHHRGMRPETISRAQMAARFGPSYADEPRRFREVFGNDDVLLKLQNDAIEKLTQRAA